MQAIHVAQHGDPSVLQVVDIPRPEPGPGEVLVRVLGVSINHLDLWVRRGMPGLDIPLPRIPGCDGAGEVVACGEGVDAPALEVGRSVLLEPGYRLGAPAAARPGVDPDELDHLEDDYGIRGEHCDGFDAEYAVLPATHMYPLPDGIDVQAVASAPLVFLTAWGLVHFRGQVKAGERVLVLAGSSGVGSAAIQVARAAGAEVMATAGSAEKAALATELGATKVVDHYDPQWPKQIHQWTGGKGADLVVEHVGAATWSGSMRCLARKGRLVTCGSTAGAKVEMVLRHLFIKNQSVLGSTMGPRSALPKIVQNIAEGIFSPVVDRVMPLSEVAQAHRLLEEKKVLGKIVLVPGS
ncbi:MAG TPA: alcohol dehydrogenase [Planctomycetes bacterium]|nr:alcohol dehydrogenase [Planctomycetota bacterium]HIK60101.1 alcohol dehydrogenase [Planctomycetota bacterium]